MSPDDVLGYLAAALVLLTFSLRSMRALRVVAIASNLAFIGYGAAAHLTPILLLHVVLLPLNVWRLCELPHSAWPTVRRAARGEPRPAVRHHPDRGSIEVDRVLLTLGRRLAHRNPRCPPDAQSLRTGAADVLHDQAGPAAPAAADAATAREAATPANRGLRW